MPVAAPDSSVMTTASGTVLTGAQDGAVPRAADDQAATVLWAAVPLDDATIAFDAPVKLGALAL